MRELFIYYRVHPHAETAARAAVHAFQTRLRQRHPGLHARLLWREDSAETRPRTWMETYALNDHMPLSSGISIELEAEIAAEAQTLAALIDGARHTEAFAEAVEPCAS